MSQDHPSNPNTQEILQKGREIYDTLKAELEPAKNGSYVAIEVTSGKYFVGDTKEEAMSQAGKEFPTIIKYVRRIGSLEKIASTYTRSDLNYDRFF